MISRSCKEVSRYFFRAAVLDDQAIYLFFPCPRTSAESFKERQAGKLTGLLSPLLK